MSFILIYKPNRDDFLETMTATEEVVLGEHFQYLQNLLKQGKLVLAGPCEDGAFGVAILKDCSEEEAKNFALNDPVVKQGVFTQEVKPFRISLLASK